MSYKNVIFFVAMLSVFSINTLMAESAGEHFDDAVIASKAKTALVRDKTVKSLKINIEVSKGILQLSGFVSSELEESTALDIAHGISGVKSVHDALVVSPGSRSAGEVLDDTGIAAKLKTKLVTTSGLGEATAITTEVKQKQVLLAGFVGSEKVKNDAIEIARHIKGVKTVYDLMVVKE